MLFYSLVSSKFCPVKDIKQLKWHYTLPEVVRFWEYVDMQDALMAAEIKDQEEEMKNNRRRG